ncbi:MAG: DUF3822 family protein [Bacteroidia bacterium]
MNTEPYITAHYKNNEADLKDASNISLFIGNQLFMYCLFNNNFTQIQEIVHVKLNHSGLKNEDLPEKLKFLIANYRLDQRSFKNVNICILNNSFTLTPQAFAMQENAKAILGFANGEETVSKHSFIHRLEELNFCYSVPGELLPFLERTFKNATVRHAGAVTIDLLLSNSSLKNADLFLNFNSGVFELAAKDNNKLVYYNVFNYESNEDVLYYLLFMMEQYQLNPLTCRLVIAGQLEESDELLKSIRKYVKHVSFAVNDKSFSSSFAGLKLPDHYFFSLTNQHLCVS